MVVTDYELVKKSLDGDQDAFAEIVTRYKRLIYTVVYKFFNDREDTNDVTQEVFIRIYKSLGSYNPQFKFSTWSVKIATNLCLDILRKKKVNSVPIEEIEMVSRDEDTPEKEYISKERSQEIMDAINALPEKYRTPILLYHKNGASYKEIVKILNMPMTMVKNRLYRARLALRESMS